MYDKYNKARPFTINSTLPTHKGIYLTHTSAGSAPVEFFNASGGTFSGSINFLSGTFNIFPIEVNKVTALTGTGYLLY